MLCSRADLTHEPPTIVTVSPIFAEKETSVAVQLVEADTNVVVSTVWSALTIVCPDET